MTPVEEIRREFIEAYVQGGQVQFRDSQWFTKWRDAESLYDIIDLHPGREFQVK